MECLRRTYENLRTETGNFAQTVKGKKLHKRSWFCSSNTETKIDRIKLIHVTFLRSEFQNITHIHTLNGKILRE
jgi:hypothetical protein